MDLSKLQIGDKVNLEDLEEGKVVSIDSYTQKIGVIFETDIAPTYFNFNNEAIIPVEITEEELSHIGFSYEKDSELLCNGKVYKLEIMEENMFAYVREEEKGGFRLFIHDYARRVECSMIVTSIHEIQQAFRLIEKIKL